MKKLKLLIFTIILLCTFTLLHTSCNKRVKMETNSIGFDSIKIVETYHLFNDPKKPNCNLSINFTFPVKYKDPEKLRLLQHIFIKSYFGEKYENKTPQEAVAFYKEEYLSNYKNLEKDHKDETEFGEVEESDDPSFLSYFENSSNSILFDKAGILTFAVEYSDYTGGVHGSHTYTAFVVNLETTKLIKEDDIFYENSQDKVSQLLLQKIMEENEVKDPKDLEYLGYDINSVIPNGNFTAEENGLTYYFNQYEIAPYVMGTIHVFLPYQEINIYMKKDGPLAKLAGL